MIKKISIILVFLCSHWIIGHSLELKDGKCFFQDHRICAHLCSDLLLKNKLREFTQRVLLGKRHDPKVIALEYAKYHDAIFIEHQAIDLIEIYKVKGDQGILDLFEYDI